MRILHTMLRVGDLPRSIDFYTRVLGMQLTAHHRSARAEVRLAFVGYGDESSGAVLELTYNYDVAGLRDRYGIRPRRDRGGRCGGDLRRGSRRRRFRWNRDARAGPGERRHDRHRVRPGSRWLQDRIDRASTSGLDPRPVRCTMPVRTIHDFAAWSSSRMSCANTSASWPCPAYSRSRPSGSNTNVPAE